jgi:polar amino acid transport system permease protein
MTAVDVRRPSAQTARTRPEDVPVRIEHRGRRVARRVVVTALTVFVLAYWAWVIVANPAMRWDTLATYLTAPLILEGVRVTVLVSIGAFAIGMLGGIVVATARMSGNVLVRSAATFYLAIFRGVPLLVQILVFYNLAAFFPTLSIGIPFTDLNVSVGTNDVITPLVASLLALGLNQAAYMGEIFRGGLLSVPRGQYEAAYGIGMTPLLAFRRIVVPQAAKSIIPPMGNDTINLVKATSLVSIVGGGDLMTRAQGISASNYQVIPLLLVASIWYLVLTAVITVIQGILERRSNVGTGTERPVGWLRAWVRNLAFTRTTTSRTGAPR